MARKPPISQTPMHSAMPTILKEKMEWKHIPWEGIGLRAVLHSHLEVPEGNTWTDHIFMCKSYILSSSPKVTSAKWTWRLAKKGANVSRVPHSIPLLESVLESLEGGKKNPSKTKNMQIKVKAVWSYLVLQSWALPNNHQWYLLEIRK